MLWERAFRKARLTGNPGFIGYLMATHDNGDGNGLRMSAPMVERYSGLGEKAARASFTKLEEARWVRRTMVGGHRGGQTLASEWTLTIPAERLDEVLTVEDALAVRTKWPHMLAAQPGDAASANRADEASQPGESSSQPGATTHPLDHDPRDPNPIDHSLDHSSSKSFRVEDYLKGDSVRREFYDNLDEEDQTHFALSFHLDDMMEFVG